MRQAGGARRADYARWGGVEPMCARQEGVVPALPRVELAEQHQQLLSGRVQAGRERGDGLAKFVCVRRQNLCAWRRKWNEWGG